MTWMATDAARQELARFLRSRRERITPADVGLPTSSRRRTRGLRREEVAVLAGVSPSWYTYLEQARDIQPSRAVLDSLATVLRLSEDERRYLHGLVHGTAPARLSSDLPADDLITGIVALFADSPYPVYAGDHRCDLIAWNAAAREWYDDWDALPPDERNIMHWMLFSPVARTRLVDWAADTRDAVARWRAEAANHPGDQVLAARVAEFSRHSNDFRTWWDQHDVAEHRSRIRRFRHEGLGERGLRIVPMGSPETVPAGVILHLPLA
jgi:transcriptional regulator with XRE-family HTH domain